MLCVHSYIAWALHFSKTLEHLWGVRALLPARAHVPLRSRTWKRCWWLCFLPLACRYVPGSIVCVLGVIFGAEKLTATQFSQFTFLFSSRRAPNPLKTNHSSWCSKIHNPPLQAFYQAYPSTLLPSYFRARIQFRARILTKNSPSYLYSFFSFSMFFSHLFPQN